MKLKKVYIYLLSFLGLSVLFSACYYLSYRRALYEFNKSAVERKDNYEMLEANVSPTQMPVDSSNASTAANETEEAEEVGTQVSATVLPTTKYILETYDKATDRLESQKLNPPAYLVGLTREEIIAYLDDYMKDMTLSEYNKGLIAYELQSFSEEEVVIRKSYDAASVPFRFYVVIKGGYVVVYNSDLKSVYNYTGIEAAKLPEKDRVQLSQGIYIDSLEELYGLLESYTS
ncbi:MAG TPA: hypothetical protein DEG06_12170 [Lachnospiraceae bacterium]|jgi:hypothetical protein|nr:hypothetical protein [Lachnospiraceae bacterium]HBY72987.1 hypothetical protein [Lachnospiraceae bacterium]HCA69362.1 hypothetical protein [Lachnospiraceae bacterium]HCM11554.1 hypothetical protein [Lachnospiraceae bacterium]HCR40368.1 hypothetical protein [Lachnospiraceae bacterium]